jgi:hypothetical protein
VRVKHLFARRRENMRNAVVVPEHFGRETVQSKEREDPEFFITVPESFRYSASRALRGQSLKKCRASATRGLSAA